MPNFPLMDGDVLLIKIHSDDKDKPIDTAIQSGEWLQEKASGVAMGPHESHVMLFVDLRSKLEQQMGSAGLMPGQHHAHLIHMEPDGLVGCELMAHKTHKTHGKVARLLGRPPTFDNGATEELLVLRCNDRKLAACAAQTAADLFLSTGSTYDWGHYRKMGAKITTQGVNQIANSRFANAATELSYQWTAANLASELSTGGMSGLMVSLAKVVAMTAATYVTKQALSYLGKRLDAYATEQTNTTPQLAGDFGMFDQFHSYYDRDGDMHLGLTTAEVCSSFVILCYQLAYVKLVRYFGHKPVYSLGPRRIQSPMVMKHLFLQSGLFQSMGTVQAAYEGSPLRYELANYGALLQRKQKTFDFSTVARRPAESPF
ncbi:hypothetical protein ACN28S_26630 [Cystobacter fuscus]